MFYRYTLVYSKRRGLGRYLNRIVSGQMDGYAGVQSRHGPVEGSLLQAHAVDVVRGQEHRGNGVITGLHRAGYGNGWG